MTSIFKILGITLCICFASIKITDAWGIFRTTLTFKLPLMILATSLRPCCSSSDPIPATEPR